MLIYWRSTFTLWCHVNIKSYAGRSGDPDPWWSHVFSREELMMSSRMTGSFWSAILWVSGEGCCLQCIRYVLFYREFSIHFLLNTIGKCFTLCFGGRHMIWWRRMEINWIWIIESGETSELTPTQFKGKINIWPNIILGQMLQERVYTFVGEGKSSTVGGTITS